MPSFPPSLESCLVACWECGSLLGAWELAGSVEACWECGFQGRICNGEVNGKECLLVTDSNSFKSRLNQVCTERRPPIALPSFPLPIQPFGYITITLSSLFEVASVTVVCLSRAVVG